MSSGEKEMGVGKMRLLSGKVKSAGERKVILVQVMERQAHYFSIRCASQNETRAHFGASQNETCAHFHRNISFETCKLTDRLFRQAQHIFFHKHKQSDGSISHPRLVDSIL